MSEANKSHTMHLQIQGGVLKTRTRRLSFGPYGHSVNFLDFFPPVTVKSHCRYIVTSTDSL